jgi:hypothetical protein
MWATEIPEAARKASIPVAKQSVAAAKRLL